MDSKEIMIGDWLLWDNTLPCIVTTIGCDYIETTKCGITLAESHLLQGVPLTREILEKNGWFPLDEYRYEGDIALAKGRNGFRLKNTTICINSVHQLQHALRLCGIERRLTYES